jgi:hypothetical protein
LYSEKQQHITTDTQQQNVTLNTNRQNKSNGIGGDAHSLLQYCQLLDKIPVIFHGAFGTFHGISKCIFNYSFINFIISHRTLVREH